MPRREEHFSRELDNLLSGRQVKPLPGEDDNGSLAFAHKMASLRPAPRPGFKSGLKARLLQELAEKEAQRAARPKWFLALLRRPAYAVALTAVFIAIIFGGLWAAGILGPETPSFTPNIVRVEADTNKDSYRSGDQVAINVSLKNITSETLNFNEFPPILSLMRESDHMAVYTFAAGTQGKSLAPGQTASFTLTWNQRDTNGNLAAKGSYFVELEDLYYKGSQVKLTPVKPAEFKIV